LWKYTAAPTLHVHWNSCFRSFQGPILGFQQSHHQVHTC
jgi:hypothetical protein